MWTWTHMFCKAAFIKLICDFIYAWNVMNFVCALYVCVCVWQYVMLKMGIAIIIPWRGAIRKKSNSIEYIGTCIHVACDFYYEWSFSLSSSFSNLVRLSAVLLLFRYIIFFLSLFIILSMLIGLLLTFESFASFDWLISMRITCFGFKCILN